MPCLWIGIAMHQHSSVRLLLSSVSCRVSLHSLLSQRVNAAAAPCAAAAADAELLLAPTHTTFSGNNEDLDRAQELLVYGGQCAQHNLVCAAAIFFVCRLTLCFIVNWHILLEHCAQHNLVRAVPSSLHAAQHCTWWLGSACSTTRCVKLLSLRVLAIALACSAFASHLPSHYIFLALVWRRRSFGRGCRSRRRLGSRPR